MTTFLIYFKKTITLCASVYVSVIENGLAIKPFFGRRQRSSQRHWGGRMQGDSNCLIFMLIWLQVLLSYLSKGPHAQSLGLAPDPSQTRRDQWKIDLRSKRSSVLHWFHSTFLRCIKIKVILIIVRGIYMYIYVSAHGFFCCICSFYSQVSVMVRETPYRQ